MSVLVVGSGGREHALAWKIKQDDPEAELYLAPGNAGTGELGRNLALKADDVDGLLKWCAQQRPEWVVVGPEVPLCLGLADRLSEIGIKVFGCNEAAARLEGSKVFTKKLLTKYGIPTAPWKAFTDAKLAREHSRSLGYPHVIKADGLAAGKGAIVVTSQEEAETAIRDMMEKRVFGEAGELVLIEEFLTGREASVFALTDGESYVTMPVAQDHKRIGDGDTGPNTGGMGAYAPAPLVDEAVLAQVCGSVLDPLFAALQKEGITYRGVLYAGLMLTPEGPSVIEFNVRFGDPEAQVLLPLLKTPFLEMAEAVHAGKMAELELEYHPGSAVTVVMAAANYPDAPRKGDAIRGLDALPAPEATRLAVFHAGTAKRNGETVTAGGRVLAVTAQAPTLEQARAGVYQGVEAIDFNGAQYRRDIAQRTGRE
ncbi:MAG: phosphoribosylamine--glycine ligase [Verrucomicrobiota bacterium]